MNFILKEEKQMQANQPPKMLWNALMDFSMACKRNAKDTLPNLQGRFHTSSGPGVLCLASSGSFNITLSMRKACQMISLSVRGPYAETAKSPRQSWHWRNWSPYSHTQRQSICLCIGHHRMYATCPHITQIKGWNCNLCWVNATHVTRLASTSCLSHCCCQERNCRTAKKPRRSRFYQE